jgi:hypothetical protein
MQSKGFLYLVLEDGKYLLNHTNFDKTEYCEHRFTRKKKNKIGTSPVPGTIIYGLPNKFNSSNTRLLYELEKTWIYNVDIITVISFLTDIEFNQIKTQIFK